MSCGATPLVSGAEKVAVGRGGLATTPFLTVTSVPEVLVTLPLESYACA